MLDRIDLGDPERVRDQRADHRAAARTGRDSLPTRVADEILHDQQVARETHVANNRQLLIQALIIGRRIELAAAPRANFRKAQLETRARAPLHLDREVDRLAIGGHGFGRIDREAKLAEFEFEIDPACDLHAVAEFFGLGAERLRHLLRSFDVQLVGVEAPARFVGHGLAGLDAEQDLVSLGVVAMQIMTVVGRDQRQSHGPADLAQCVVIRRMQFVVLQLEVIAIFEDARVPFGALARFVHLARAQRSRNFARQASRKHDQSGVVLFENFLVDARLVVEPFLVGRREQLAQVAIALAVLDQQDQVEVATTVEVVAARGLGAIGALAAGEIRLASDDRLDPGGDGLLVELDRAEHVAMVGDRQRLHPGGLRMLDQRGELVGSVKQAVLRMDVQMGKTHRGTSRPKGRRARCAPPNTFPTQLREAIPSTARKLSRAELLLACRLSLLSARGRRRRGGTFFGRAFRSRSRCRTFGDSTFDGSTFRGRRDGYRNFGNGRRQD